METHVILQMSLALKFQNDKGETGRSIYFRSNDLLHLPPHGTGIILPHFAKELEGEAHFRLKVEELQIRFSADGTTCVQEIHVPFQIDVSSLKTAKLLETRSLTIREPWQLWPHEEPRFSFFH